MKSTYCFVCLNTCNSRDGGNCDDDHDDLYKSIFFKFVKEYLQISSSSVSVNQNGEVLVDSHLVKGSLCECCDHVVSSICQLYLELLGVQLRLSWKLGELGKLLIKSSLKEEATKSSDAEDEIADAAVFLKTDRGSHLVEVRNLLALKCAQKARECPPKIPSSVCNDDDDQTFASSLKDTVVNSGRDADVLTKRETDGDLDENENTNSNSSDNDWCPSDNDEDAEDDDEQRKRCPRTVKFPDMSGKKKASSSPKRRRKQPKSKPKPSIKPSVGRLLKGGGRAPSWDCELCGPTTNLRIPHLKKHELAISKKEYSCCFCYKDFALQQSLDHHVKHWHPKKLSKEGKFLCHVHGCQGFDNNPQQSFDTISQLNDHLKETHLTSDDGATDIQLCPTCGLGFTDENLLKLHELLHFKPISDGKTRHVICPVCGKAVPLSDLSSLQSHYNYFHGSILKILKCSQCGTRCTSVKALRNHKRMVHKDKKDNGTGWKLSEAQKLQLAADGPNWCEECGKELKNQLRLENHQRRAHKQVNCDICEYKFIGLDALKEHRIKVHKFHDVVNGKDGESNPCPLCDKSYPSRLQLQQHTYQVHSEAKRECDICHKSFTMKHHLKQHLKNVHSVGVGDDGNICPHCGKKLGSLSSLNSHLSCIHPELVSSTKRGRQNDKHKCPNCPEKFRWKAALHRHIIKVHPKGKLAEGMLECNVCGMRLPMASKSLMDYHKSTHLTMEERRSGGKLHMCHVCGKEFRTAYSYKGHLRMHENNESKNSNITSA